MNPLALAGFTWYTKHSRTIENMFAVLFVVLFAYALADWFGVLPGERGFQPLRMVLLSAALLLQALGSIARRHYTTLFYVCLVTSLIPLVASFFVAR